MNDLYADRSSRLACTLHRRRATVTPLLESAAPVPSASIPWIGVNSNETPEIKQMPRNGLYSVVAGTVVRRRRRRRLRINESYNSFVRWLNIAREGQQTQLNRINVDPDKWLDDTISQTNAKLMRTTSTSSSASTTTNRHPYRVERIVYTNNLNVVIGNGNIISDLFHYFISGIIQWWQFIFFFLVVVVIRWGGVAVMIIIMNTS